ncbi:hypothetical protein V5799_034140 [Amblyomma americanum]|uniref:Uncharacterized protein n=1 Tax=Amblyomma americanum TaxID=6943 RepID=A0AAQ4DLB3_AMBAM
MRPSEAQRFLENLGRRASERRVERTDSTEWEGDKGRCSTTSAAVIAVLSLVSISAIVIGKVAFQHVTQQRVLAKQIRKSGSLLAGNATTPPVLALNVSGLNYSDLAIDGIFE